MLEIRNLRLPLSGAARPEAPYDEGRLRDAVARKLGCRPSELASCAVARRSVDARRKGDVHFVATAVASLSGGAAAEARALSAASPSRDVSAWEEPGFSLPRLARPGAGRPVVVGAGAAGLFAAVALAEAGMAPVLIERGEPAGRRAADVARFNAEGALDPESNVQFGAGGAGTFSDGKLTTGTTSPANRWVLKAFVDAGAPPDILWQGMPHIGSDALPRVVDGLVARIERAGGEVRWRCRALELVVEGGRLAGVRAERAGRAEELRCSRAVLACGHSARDLMASLAAQGFTLVPKPFSMGLRVEHPQAWVDSAQYGRAAGHPALPAASYKLSCHLPGGRGVYTFCMCPGGEVVAAASEPGGVVTNGMSEYARAGENANAALLVSVLPEDIPGSADDPLAGERLQRACEQAAFEAGGGAFRAPVQLLGDFLGRAPSSGPGSVRPTYPRGVSFGSLDGLLPAFVEEALREGARELALKMRGFDRPDAVLTGVETRSSSPVRLPRDEGCQSVDARGLYPCGEGAGYAGGIMSAAVDGLRCAAALVDAANACGPAGL